MTLPLKKTTPACLLVDDNELLVRALARRLETSCGLRVHYVRNGIRALRVLEHAGFDVIVCDLRMPGPDGLQVLGTCSERWPAMRRVLLTAFSAAEQIEQGVADLVLDKRLSTDQVIELICLQAQQPRHAR